MKYAGYYIILFLLVVAGTSCSYSKKFTTTYYQENEAIIQSIKTRYKELYDKHPFSVEIQDKDFKRIGFEITTDSIKYIYTFTVSEPYLIDTLEKYRFDVKGVTSLINDMQRVHCTWITKVDYYEKGQQKFLVFISIRHQKLKAFLRPEKYFTLAFFDNRQPFDEKGRLLDRDDRKSLHSINGSIFRRISDRVCYSVGANFR